LALHKRKRRHQVRQQKNEKQHDPDAAYRYQDDSPQIRNPLLLIVPVRRR
jgi:hypothetical protein